MQKSILLSEALQYCCACMTREIYSVVDSSGLGSSPLHSQLTMFMSAYRVTWGIISITPPGMALQLSQLPGCLLMIEEWLLKHAVLCFGTALACCMLWTAHLPAFMTEYVVSGPSGMSDCSDGCRQPAADLMHVFCSSGSCTNCNRSLHSGV